MSNHTPLLGVDTRMATGSRRSYSSVGDLHGGPSVSKSRSPETYRSGNPLSNVPEEIDDEDLEETLEEEGLYLATWQPNPPYTGSYKRLVQTYTFVPVTSLLVWLLAAFVPPLIWPTDAPTTPPVPYFSTPLPEFLLSTSLFALSHLLNPFLFALTGVLLPHPVSANVVGTALHVLLRNALRVSAFPLLRITVPDGVAMCSTPAFRSLWWFALGWSLAEVVVGVVQGYETLALYRDALVPQGRARELAAAALSTGVRASKNGGATNTSPLRTWDERQWESCEDGVAAGEAIGSPVRSYPRTMSGADIQLEVDKDFDELVAVKAREELEELYGFPAIHVPVFVSCLLRIASILLSLGFVLLLSAGYLTSPPAILPVLEKNGMIVFVPSSWSDGTLWGTFVAVCGVNLGLSLLHTPVFLPRVGVHVVAYLGLLVGLGTLFAGLGMWDALS
ncbi:hypothetical protein EDB92DRAFT_1800610 [Lactarius akahatsu]|uniref:Uncharacterized protein n=1 Tax=Lactarius akahatsu TaxID=416441 RepID=A0AAD4LEL7_9AGAM|nr:hypothetical protein EDB92DRAFT_1800610 [Lactarius akahatsu]